MAPWPSGCTWSRRGACWPKAEVLAVVAVVVVVEAHAAAAPHPHPHAAAALAGAFPPPLAPGRWGGGAGRALHGDVQACGHGVEVKRLADEVAQGDDQLVGVD